MNLKETEDGVVVEFFVKPNSKSFKITIDDGEIVVFCTEQPVKGKVNKELLKEFSKLFHAKIEFVSGLTSKQKRLLITGVAKSEVEQLLCAE
ncbi:YggU family protein [Candidatus Bathyarchaeota archaeon]|nr:YggU family protein [Candidatus Bathyarchaeota archaeon]